MIKTYENYLQLHAHHTLWKVNSPIELREYYSFVGDAMSKMENHFKDLKVYQCGRSGRHICVDDTPVNRRRYQRLVEYAETEEKKLVGALNERK